MLAIAIGDLQLNQTSQVKISMKYSFPKTKIQRIMIQDPAHCKGGCQYQAEQQKKRKAAQKEQVKVAEEVPTKKGEETTRNPSGSITSRPGQ